MAVEVTHYLDYSGLAIYTTQMKTYIANAEGKIKVANTHFTIPDGATSATVESALAQLVDEQADAKVALQETAGTASDTFAKKYTLWTGDIKPEEADPYADATKIGDINIPKDFLCKSATVETCAEDDKPVAGYKVGDKYIDFVINAKEVPGAEDEHMYLLVKDLVDVYTAAENADQVQLAIDEHNVISAELVDGGVDLDALAQEVKDDYAIDVTITAGGDTDEFSQKVVISQGVDEDGDPIEKATLTLPKDYYTESGTCEYLNAEAIAAITDAEGTAPTQAGYYIKLALANKNKTVYVPVSAIASGFSVLNTHKDAEGAQVANSVTLTKDTTDPTDAKLSAEITDGGVTEAKLADDAVTTDKIKDGQVTLDKAADDLLSALPGVIPLTGDNSIASLFEEPTP